MLHCIPGGLANKDIKIYSPVGNLAERAKQLMLKCKLQQKDYLVPTGLVECLSTELSVW